MHRVAPSCKGWYDSRRTSKQHQQDPTQGMVHCEPFPTPTDRIQVHRTAQDDATSSSRFGTCTASLVPTIPDPFIANCRSIIFPASATGNLSTNVDRHCLLADAPQRRCWHPGATGVRYVDQRGMRRGREGDRREEWGVIRAVMGWGFGNDQPWCL